MFSDEQLQRYSRQLLIDDFDIAGQQRLHQATVLIVGAGGLGNPAALYLAAAGVGRLLLADGDAVELSNLQRQIAHTEAKLELNKAQSLAQAVAALNSETRVEVISSALEANTLDPWVKRADIVLDCSDNYPTRFALNRACISAALPLVSGAAVRTEGQVAVFNPAAGGPCYRCLYPQEGAGSALSCAQSGVLAPVVGVIGSLQAMEAIKLLAAYGEPLLGRLLVMDFRDMSTRTLSVQPRADCPDCGGLD